jgi:hypothetical protein
VRPSDRVLLAACLTFAALVFTTGIQWGLPSRAADPYLFGDREPWDGKHILELTGGMSGDPSVGADVDLNPLGDRSKPILLNATDQQRAEIVRRYRLFTYQPDEWNTMRSLAGMKPGQLQLDPRLYQYGGLWVYPIGALLKVASVVGYIKLTPDLAFYLDHPEEFAKFYVVARLYSAAWGVVGAWAVFLLARKLTGSTAPAAVASIGWAMMPVVVNMSHEAKPHLAGLSLMLLAILAACRYVETGKTRWWAIAGALCGAAFGMVISSLIIFIILPVMTLLRPMRWVDRISVAMQAIGVGFLVYAVTNPYVWINAIHNPAVLRSNIGTSTAMYQATPGSGLANAVSLIREGTSVTLGVFGAIGLITLLTWRRMAASATVQASKHVLWLLSVPAFVVVAQFLALASGKPAEYARFALLPDTVLCVAAVTFAWVALRHTMPRALMMFALLMVTLWGGNYLRHFLADTRMRTPRLNAAARLQSLNAAGSRRLAVVAEPAPYAMPPVDLWRWEMYLLPRTQVPVDAAHDIDADVVLRAVDRVTLYSGEHGYRTLDPMELNPFLSRPAPISWAAKPFEILVRETPPASAGGGSAGPAASAPSPAPDAP